MPLDDKWLWVSTDRCRVCGKGGLVRLLRREWITYKNGASIEDALTTITDGEREQIASGTHHNCNGGTGNVEAGR